jgi:hypothetical protein
VDAQGTCFLPAPPSELNVQSSNNVGDMLQNSLGYAYTRRRAITNYGSMLAQQQQRVAAWRDWRQHAGVPAGIGFGASRRHHESLVSMLCSERGSGPEFPDWRNKAT